MSSRAAKRLDFGTLETKEKQICKLLQLQNNGLLKDTSQRKLNEKF